MSLISCQNISKTFGVRQLFENLSIVISEGERIGFIGPNGSGKSTLVSILAGVKIRTTESLPFARTCAWDTFRRSRDSLPARPCVPFSVTRSKKNIQTNMSGSRA